MSLTQLPSMLMHRLSHMIEVEMDRRLKPYGLTRSQWGVVMMLLKQEGRSQTEIQEVMRLERATVTGLLQRMEAQGWVERRADTQDKRVQRVYLTERSRAMESVAVRIIEEVNAQALTGFSEDEQAFFRRLIERAISNMETP